MKLGGALGVLAAGVIVAAQSLASAALVVSAGDWELLPNTPNQPITIQISGTGQVTNATVVIEIGNGSPMPSITGGDIVDGTIFASNNSGAPSYDFTDSTVAYLDVATNSGTVAVTGTQILATLVISTVDVFEGSFPLKLIGTAYGDSVVGTEPTVDVSFVDGQITIVPEPMLGGLMFLLVVARVRRRTGLR